jgi:hypothetical protein
MGIRTMEKPLMNERIKELAADARGQMAVLTTVDEQAWKQHEEFVEKFAELIVAECADLCESFGESGDGYTCSAEILEHFGVEE